MSELSAPLTFPTQPREGRITALQFVTFKYSSIYSHFNSLTFQVANYVCWNGFNFVKITQTVNQISFYFNLKCATVKTLMLFEMSSLVIHGSAQHCGDENRHGHKGFFSYEGRDVHVGVLSIAVVISRTSFPSVTHNYVYLSRTNKQLLCKCPTPPP